MFKERRGQVNTMLMEHFNNILFYKSGPANKQHINIIINQYVVNLFDRSLRTRGSVLETES
jgi:hypothetical protein